MYIFHESKYQLVFIYQIANLLNIPILVGQVHLNDESPKDLLYMQNWLPKHLIKIINALLFHFSISQQPFKTFFKHLNLHSHKVVSVIVFSSISIFIHNNLKISLEISKFHISPADKRNGSAKFDVPWRWEL